MRVCLLGPTKDGSWRIMHMGTEIGDPDKYIGLVNARFGYGWTWTEEPPEHCPYCRITTCIGECLLS